MPNAQEHFPQARQRNSYRKRKVFDENRREISSNFWEIIPVDLYNNNINEDKLINFGSKFLQDFRGMCAEQAAVPVHIELSHLNQSLLD